MAAGGNANNIALGAGRLYYAPLGTTEPTDSSTALPVAWKVIGYTEDGSSISFGIETAEIEVAEELYPVGNFQTKASASVKFQMAEATKSRLALALGAGAAVTDDTTPWEPPALGAQVPIMMAWDKMDTPTAANVRILFRSCLPTGTIEIKRGKAPNKSLIPVEMKLAISGTSAPFKVFPGTGGIIA